VLTDLAGGKITVNRGSARSTVTSAQGQAAITELDITTSDGIIYVIDTVI
jgi:uncharacterized surface protein with fasciclin (FAS1) repeats